VELVKVLLDSCVLLWWWSEPDRLSPRVTALIKDSSNAIYVSAATAWEIATKHRIGKLPGAARVIEEWDQRVSLDRFTEVPVTSSHAFRAGTLPGSHRDPFNRMLAAQGIMENAPILTPDVNFESLGAQRIW
jgi:PIN domain nuclease of toxin-antitoxin system